MLQARISELERRLERLELEMGDLRGESSGPSATVIDISPVGRARPDAAVTGVAAVGDGDAQTEAGEPEVGHEGARLVALELLSSGYGRDEVATYLRSTFGIANVDSVIGGAGPASS